MRVTSYKLRVTSKKGKRLVQNGEKNNVHTQNLIRYTLFPKLKFQFLNPLCAFVVKKLVMNYKLQIATGFKLVRLYEQVNKQNFDSFRLRSMTTAQFPKGLRSVSKKCLYPYTPLTIQ